MNENIKTIAINYIIKSFRFYGVFLTENQARICYENYLKENRNLNIENILDYSQQNLVNKLSSFIPKNKLKFLM